MVVDTLTSWNDLFVISSCVLVISWGMCHVNNQTYSLTKTKTKTWIYSFTLCFDYSKSITENITNVNINLFSKKWRIQMTPISFEEGQDIVWSTLCGISRSKRAVALEFAETNIQHRWTGRQVAISSPPVGGSGKKSSSVTNTFSVNFTGN